MKKFAVLVVFAAWAPAPVIAEVSDAANHGFTVVNEVVIAAPRAEVWRAAVAEVGHWWSSDHTVGGDALRLRIDPVPLGCFCEDLRVGAGVAHLTVTMVNPGVVIRMTGGLGPLGLMGVQGNMTWEFDDAEAGGTIVRFTYVVGGYRPGGLDEMAAPVDFVIGEALARLKQYAQTGSPEVEDVG